jgi:hypothetical protein
VQPLAEPAVLERLTAPIVVAALGNAGEVAACAISARVSSLAERVLKMMLVTKLTQIVAALITAAGVTAVGLAAMAPPGSQSDAPGRADDLPGRVVDRSGAAVAGARIWALYGGRDTETVATATTDGEGRFVLPRVVNRIRPPGYSQDLGLFARARDGSIGWLRPRARGGPEGQGVSIELEAVGDLRSRLTDQGGRPIAGVDVAPVLLSRTDTDYQWLSPEASAVLRATTAADGSFVLKGIPRGATIYLRVADPKFGTPMVSWDTSQAGTIVLDGRLGRIKGRLNLPEAARPDLPFTLSLVSHGRPRSSATGAFGVVCFRNATTDRNGTFQFETLPPGRYTLRAYFDENGIIATKPQSEIEVGPGAVATIEVPLQRQPMIAGQVVDAQSGNGIAEIGVRTLWREEGKNFNLIVSEATTDAKGRYRIAARPGKTVVELTRVPATYRALDNGRSLDQEVKADQAWPDIKLTSAVAFDGVVVDAAGRPVPSAEVYYLFTRKGRGARQEPVRTALDGTFRLDGLDPDGKVSFWARAGDATTDGAVVAKPREGKVTLKLDPKFTVRLRGQANDGNSRRIAGAEVRLRWMRWVAPEDGKPLTMATTTVLATGTTSKDGWFVFRGLWPGATYSAMVEARGHDKGESSEVIGKVGETQSIGKIVLLGTGGYVAGRVIGSDGQPIVGAAVFNRADAPEPIATSTDPQGRFRLDGFLPGTRFAFVRKQGYRFTGVKADRDRDNLTITLLRADEPPPPWKPAATASHDEQRAFARQILIRIWEKYGSGADDNGAFSCIVDMAAIDPDLALEWSAEKGHRFDNNVRRARARALAEADATSALALLKPGPDTESQSVLQDLADRFAETDPAKAMPFAKEAAVQARGLNPSDRALAMARAGAVLVKLGRIDLGRGQIEEAARDATKLPTAGRDGYYRAVVAGILAPYDVERALALIEPIQVENDAGHRNRAMIAVALAATDTRRALALVETVGGTAFFHEMARTSIAFRIGRDRPDEAIRIIEDTKRDPATIWQAEAYGWLAVALAPRDRQRAYSLIDRGLSMMIDERDSYGRSAWSGGEMAGAAHVALCARRCGYPDMDSAVMRVLAARPADPRHGFGERQNVMRSIAVSAVPLALVDPGAARAVLEQLESRPGFDPVTLWNVRAPWLVAWSLVDLAKAREVFEAELSALDREKKVVNLWGAGFFQMVELLTAPPDRREDVLGRQSGGASWRPGEDL